MSNNKPVWLKSIKFCFKASLLTSYNLSVIFLAQSPATSTTAVHSSEPTDPMLSSKLFQTVSPESSVTSAVEAPKTIDNEDLETFSNIYSIQTEFSNILSQGLDPRSNPNEDRLPQTTPQVPFPKNSKPLDIEERPVTPKPPDPTVDPSEPAPNIAVLKIDVVGSTILGPDEINPIIQPLEGQSVTLTDLRGAADAITLLYINQGYITSRAVLVDQTITDGTVQIQVIEGTLEAIEVEGNGRLKASYIRDRIQQGISTPLNTTRLEQNLRLLSIDPLFKEVKGSLKPGTALGQSILVMKVIKDRPWDLTLGFDNYSVPSLAPERGGLNFIYRNVSGLGDQVAASYHGGFNFGNFTQADVNIYHFSYRVPLNVLNGTLQFRTDINNSSVTDPAFALLNIEGESELFDLSFRQPVIRTLRQELALSLGFTIQNGESLISPPFLDELNRNRVLGFGQDYLRRDAAGFWAARSQFNFGLGILGSIPSGEFFSWSGQGQRVQRLGNDFLLILQGDLQFTPDDLPSFYEFVIGGGQSIRGYRQNSRSGDNGYRFSAEGRIPILRNREKNPTLQFAPFFDVGQVWNTGDDAVAEGFLAGVGIGVLWEPVSGFNIRVDYGYPIISITPAITRSLQDEAIYFSITYSP